MTHDIDIHIDQLILDGVNTSNPELVRSAVTQELARLFADRGLPAQMAQAQSYARVSTGTITPAGNPAAVGNSIAGAVYQGLRTAKTNALFNK